MTRQRQFPRIFGEFARGSSSPSLHRLPRIRAGITKRRFLFLVAGTPLASLRVGTFPIEPKVSPEEVVGRHLKSLGPEQIRAKILYREARGTCTKFGRLSESRGRAFLAGGNYSGGAELFLSHSHFRMTLLFENEEYPVDSMIFDGTSVRVALSSVGEAGRLTAFLGRHDIYLKEGLFGGALSIDWLLLREHGDFSDFRPQGRKRFKGQDCLKLKYLLAKRDQSVAMYFSTETGRHVGTDYGSPLVDSGLRIGISRQDRLVESFSDFKEYDGLTLPTFWEIEMYSAHGKERWVSHFQSISHKGPQLRRP